MNPGDAANNVLPASIDALRTQSDTTASAATVLASEEDRINAPTAAAPPARHVAQLGRDYAHGRKLFNAAKFGRHRRSSEEPLYRPLRVYLSDPVASTAVGGVTVISVPYEPLKSGPSGKFLAVVDGDEIWGKRVDLADLDCLSALLDQGHRPSTTDPAFHQQMVYAVCSEVAAVFTGALGRDLSWGSDTGILKLRPHYGEDRNAYYDPESNELRFGYFKAVPEPGPGLLPHGTVFTCLSHDIIAHEMTHAVLDGMRSRFQEPTNTDVLAFHEGFADIVAILLHFGHAGDVKDAIVRSVGKIGADPTIFSLAAQFGGATGANGPLRTALGTDAADSRVYGFSDEPHELGSVLVSAILEALSQVFERRASSIKALIAAYKRPEAPLHPTSVELLAAIAMRTSNQFLALCIRAIDYCPPIDIRFGEYLRALITADHDLVEDDRDGFRHELITAFARRKIFPDDVPDISEESLLWRGPDRVPPRMPGLSFDALQLRPDPGESPSSEEIEREAGALADVVTDPDLLASFGLSSDKRAGLPTIESIRILRRVGPDRQVRFGLVCEVLQQVRVASGDREIEMTGGSTVIMDSAGTIRFVIRKAADRANRVAAVDQFRQSALGAKQSEAYDEGRTWAALHERHR
ncbi:hypothetical protein SAMN02745157_4967 [Kaistia soli DSM 19436]|uniref:Peptidase M4 n=1 Tax=Kaistia soli DSM 19436 TaxID=1122133 RepID=A0A1M5NAI1_9HYPH|nr:hypothetical protein [Kaistia soli]SHG86530.1 hypothetical protein SAMN02745157_4967 [Kaistia soli DSM 19436]